MMEKLFGRRNALMAQVKGELSAATKLDESNSQSEVRERLEQLKVLANNFRAVQGEIEESQQDPAAIASVFDVREEFFGMYYKAKTMFEAALEEVESSASQQTIADSKDWKDAMHLLIETQRQILIQQQLASRTTTHSGNGLREDGQVSNAAPQLHVRLPAINVPTFSGQRKEWLTFKDLYQSTIHGRNDISASLKMQYLFSYLEGDAKRLVNKFTISSANYDKAWDALCTHYDKKRFTVFSLVREFMDQPTVTNSNPQALSKLVTTSDEVVQQLDALGKEFRGRDPWLIHLMLEKLDRETQTSWSQKVIENDNPSFEDLLSFLKKRCEALETCSAFSKKEVIKKEAKSMPSEKKVKALHAVASNQKCAKCSKEHNTFLCEDFKKMSVEDRRSLAQKNKLCFNCLRPFHCAKFCSSKSVCRTPECKQRHHTLLCPGEKKVERAEENSSESAAPEKIAESVEKNITALTMKLPAKESQTISLLPTAVVNVQKVDGSFLQVRVLIDSGSQASLVSEECVRKLELPRRTGKLVVSGLGEQEVGTTRGVVSLQLAPRFNEIVVITTNAYVLGKLTSTIPSQKFKLSNMKLLENLGELADPMFNQPASIDIILGSDVFLGLLEGGQVKDECGLTVAQRTVFGWIVAGRYDEAESINSNHAIINLHTEVDLNRTLRQFWEQEELRNKPQLTPSEIKVIEHFKSTLTRDENGRFIVRLPFDDAKPPLGESMTAALKRLKSMQKRFEFKPEFKREYEAFIREYLELNHMEEVPAEEIDKDPAECYYLPHHAVIKQESSTTKLRVVFDASCASSTGVSLNDRLIAGPNNNEDLWPVSLRFRSHRVAFSGDVAKMYRQVWVHKQDRDFLRILWIDEAGQMKHYRLRTVTYGTKTAPYQAIEAMREAAKPYEEVYPEAVKRIKTDFYVDDFLSGADNEDEAKQLKDQVAEILCSAGFELRKWTSNSEALLSESTPVPIKLSEHEESVKALGISWYPTDDEYGFKISLPVDSVNTKRQMISDSSRLFDPFGWLTPVMVKIKILYQYLWLFDIGWDDQLPPAISSEWIAVKNNLHRLEEIRIPRFTGHFGGKLQIHGFSDASEQAYAAVVYSRAVDDLGNVSVVMVAAKSRVAPIKQVSLPRLELNGALLLAKLMKKVTDAWPHLEIEQWAWTDSTIVLHWLSAHPRKWKTYVANRTAEILEQLPRQHWNHVRSEENPADCASRGLSPAELVEYDLWFQGPGWLKGDQSTWNISSVQFCGEEEHLETRQQKVLHTAIAPARQNFGVECHLLERRSNFTLIVRSLAWVNRFVYNITRKASEDRRSDELTPAELAQARAQVARAVQHDVFESELEQLRKDGSLRPKSALSSLYPFLDDQGTMRVGGRLQNSTLPYEVKHPIILPQNHRVTTLLVRDLHLRNLHAGPALLTASINQQYWIIGCQTVVRKVVQECTRCVRLKGKVASQLMGSLPPARVLATRPFCFVGVDYAGPLKIKATCVRGVKVTKGYIAVYVCLSTRAVHLEAASDMSTNTFLGTLKRFISRRGYPNEIWSDNGTNFAGADRTLQELLEQVHTHDKDASRFLSNIGIKWTFIPPSAPHMGGIWEAAVKSAKWHLVAELGTEALTFEDLSTILCQTEACLNSRPICALSTNPDSCEALTPGHFLIGQSMNLIPEPDLKRIPTNRLDQWQQVQQKSAVIWNRWKDEYLTSLQPRGKWRTTKPNVQVDQLVLVKNDNAPPAQWELARVVQVHADPAGIVRTVTLRRGQALYQRPIHKLCLLPSA